MVFKKHLSPLSKGGQVLKHAGKGSKQQQPMPGGRESMTGGDPVNRMLNRYPTAPQPTNPTPAPAAPLGGPAMGPSPAPIPPPTGLGAGLPDDDGDEAA